MMEESIFKSCLKRKVKFTSGTFVKFLITGTVALSLTACGGGGGGGSSSSSGNGGGTTLQDKYVEKEFGSDKTISEKMDLSSVNADSVIGILAHNSNIKNETEITINDKSNGSKIMTLSSDEAKSVLDFYQKNGESFAIFSDGGSVVNTANGKLNITGDKVTGILGVYSDITNEGEILTSQNEKDSVEATGIITLGGNVTNKGKIDIHSHEGVGIYAMNNIKLDDPNMEINSNKTIEIINDGKISVIGEESRGIVAAGSDINVINNGELFVKGTDVDGIVGQEGQNITITNSSTGIITAENKGGNSKTEYMNGINIKDKGKNTQAVIINDGIINITGAEGNYIASGISGDGKMTVTNNGTIKVNAKTHLETSGIDIENGEATNNGNITIEAQYNKFAGENLSYNLANASKGMKATKNGKIINGENGKINVSGSTIGMYTTTEAVNNGTIEMAGKAENADDYMTAMGMVADGGNITNGEKGTIKSSLADINGMLVIGNGTGENFGTINLSGNEVEAMTAENGKIINHKDITLSGESSIGMRVDVGTGENKGTVTINGFDSWGMSAGNGSTIKNTNGTINVNGENSVGMIAETGGQAENSGNINIDSEYISMPNTPDEIFDFVSKGMLSEGGMIKNETDGTITVSGSAIGMLTDNTNKAENNGKIIISNSKNTDTTNKFTGAGMASRDKGEISNLGSITSNVNNTIGMLTSNGTINNLTDSNGKQAEIKLSGNEVSGMIGFGNSNINNTGIITLNGEEATGIKTYGESIIDNKGVISVKGTDTAGIVAEGKSTIINEGKIYLEGDDVTAIDAEDSKNATVTNKGEIFVKNTAKYDFGNENADWVGATGIIVSGAGSKGTNEKEATITVEGDNGRGMQAVNGAEVINNGTIKVSGKGAFGMVAEAGSTATNNGRIDIVDTEIQSSEDKIETEAGGMLADGGNIVNNGYIYIDSSMKVNDNEQAKKDFALRSTNEGTITNNGHIIVTEDVKIETPDMSAYIIGTNKDGSYGKVSAETVTVDGNVKVSAEMAKEGYKDSYALDNAIAGKTELKENYKLSSTSLLYNAVSKTDEEGNLDVELVRNDTDISDLASKEISKAAGIFDSAMKDETLSEKEKEILEKVFDSTSSAEGTDRAVKEITGYNVYSNIARQIFDTKDMFVSYDKSIINSLGDYNFNFNFIGNYADVNSKNKAAGYDSRVTGINGAVRFTDSLYGVIGYGYNDVDYDGNSDGTIETIHTGIYKDIKSQFGNIRTGIFGEYNFHETDRKISGEKADSDFNSYLIGANIEISRKFGDDLYIKPALSFDLSYGEYEDFREDGGADVKFEKQDYVSAVPAIELKLGKGFETSEIYGAVKYSYELGDLNKEQEIELLGHKEDFQADNIEDAQTDIKFGANFNIKNISVNGEIGKEFGKRDREYIKAGFSYTF